MSTYDDLPTLGGTVLGGATADLMEAIGFGPRNEQVVHWGQTNLLGYDLHSNVQVFQPFGVLTYANQKPSFTFERWVRWRFSPPFGSVGLFRFWATNTSIGPGWAIRWGMSTKYHRPVLDRSRYAKLDLPTSDPGRSNPNIGTGTRLLGDEVRYTPWIVLQAEVDALVEPELMATAPGLVLHFAWSEA